MKIENSGILVVRNIETKNIILIKSYKRKSYALQRYQWYNENKYFLTTIYNYLPYEISESYSSKIEKVPLTEILFCEEIKNTLLKIKSDFENKDEIISLLRSCKAMPFYKSIANFLKNIKEGD